MLTSEKILSNRPMAATESTAVMDVKGCSHFAVQVNITASPAAVEFEDEDVTVASDLITKAAHGLYTGLKVQLTTAGVLPDGLELTTDYWVIRVSASTFKLAASLADADAGTAVDITAAAGGGTHTVTATAGALSHSLQLQKSCDGSNWVSEGAAVAISATGSQMLEGSSKGYHFARVTNTVTTGQAVYDVILNGK
jgi:hypothetical protein